MPDGRHLGYLTVGEGKSVVYFHGTASSRLEVKLLTELAYTARLQIISIDRPGYGLSTFVPQRSLCDFAGDINFLVDHLGIERFGVIGWSGGGVFALAYAALFPERITRAVIVGSPALPFDVSTAYKTPFARYIMRLRFLGMLALKGMQAQTLKANGNIERFFSIKARKTDAQGVAQRRRKVFFE